MKVFMAVFAVLAIAYVVINSKGQLRAGSSPLAAPVSYGSTLTIPQAKRYAAQAGFTGQAQSTIVAIAIAESGLRTDIRGRTDSRDRGILQINSYWHAEVSDDCAFDPACAFEQAYRISGDGQNFASWDTYRSGVYSRFMREVQGEEVLMTLDQSTILFLALFVASVVVSIAAMLIYC